jgi:hypothetical protein
MVKKSTTRYVRLHLLEFHKMTYCWIMILKIRFFERVFQYLYKFQLRQSVHYSGKLSEDWLQAD